MHLNATPCANTQALNAYLAGIESADRREDWEEGRAAKILKDMQPFDGAAVSEALTEMDREGDAKLAAALATGDDATAGAALKAAVLAYWTAYAKKKAEDDYAAISCYSCLDEGCRKCDGDYMRDARRDEAFA